MIDHENGGGAGSGKQSDAHTGEEQWNDRSDGSENTKFTQTSVPSFRPAELDDFGDTGHDLIKLNSPKALSKDGKPIGKAPRHSGWRTTDPLSLEEAKEHLESGCNVGVRLRLCDLVLDVDPRNFAADDDPLFRLGKKLDIDWSDFPKVVTGSDGYHFYMSMPEGLLVSDTLEDYPGLEFKSHGRQMVAPGSVHPDTGRCYIWDPLTIPINETPDAPQILLELIKRPDRVNNDDTGGGRTPEQLKEMLSGLNVAEYGEHDVWLELMMASHHATGGDGRLEFIEWSTGDPNYSSDEWRIGRRWDSLHADAKGRRVTEKTLFMALHKADKGHLIPKDSVGDDFANYQDSRRPLSEYDALEFVNSSHFTVLTAGKYLVGRESICPNLHHTKVEWYPDEAIRKHIDSRLVLLSDDKRKPLGSWWVKHPQRRQYEGVIFDPNPRANHPDQYNLWRGWSVKPQQGDWSLMKQLLKEVLCGGDKDSFDYALKWSAFMVQFPHKAAEVAMVFKGSKGIGKGTFARELMKLAGAHGRQVAQAEHFTGRFNEHLSDTILLFVDEGMWGGDKKLEGAVKNLITEPMLTFEGKNKPIISGPNRLHIVIASNEQWVVPATSDERRFAIFEANDAARKNLPPDFFGMLNKQMRNGGTAAMLHDLQHVVLTGWHPRDDVPATKGLIDQKLQGLRSDPIAFWWHRKLEDGHLDCLLDSSDWPNKFVWIGSKQKDWLINDLETQARVMGKRSEFTKNLLARRLSEFGINVKARDTKGNRCWLVPELAGAKTCFENWLGGTVDWDTES